LIITDGGLVSIDTDPNVIIVDNISFIFVLMLYLKLSCFRHNLTLHTTFNILKGKGNNVITGSFVSPYGKMIYVENHNILLVILNEDGTFDKEIPCSLSDPLDVTCLDDALDRSCTAG
jgi:hypothetical protein